MDFHDQKFIPDTSVQVLNPRPCVDNAHTSILSFEMTVIEPGDGEIPTRKLKPLGFLIHIKCRVKDDRFPLSLREVLFCFILGVPIPALMGPSQQCDSNALLYDSYGDHLQTCQTKSATSQVHEWMVYKLGVLLDSVGHRVKIHKITPSTGKERGDIEIRDYVVLQKPQGNRLPVPRTLSFYFTMTHTCYVWSIQRK